MSKIEVIESLHNFAATFHHMSMYMLNERRLIKYINFKHSIQTESWDINKTYEWVPVRIFHGIKVNAVHAIFHGVSSDVFEAALCMEVDVSALCNHPSYNAL